MNVLDDVSLTYLTAPELATILRVHRTTITKKAKDGEIPGALMVGAEWRFRRETVKEWLAKLEKNSGER